MQGADGTNGERTPLGDRAVPLEVGDAVRFSKTVGESDVYLFAGITGDFSPNHINEETMKGTPYGQRVAHGVLSLGFASTTSTAIVERSGARAVSYGYDNIRFVGPIFVGDTITVTYVVLEVDEEGSRSRAKIEICNQRDELCTVAEHILKFLP